MKEKSIASERADSFDAEDQNNFELEAITIDDISHQNVQRSTNERVSFAPVKNARKVSLSSGAASGKERRRRLSQMNVHRRHWMEAVMKLQTMSDPWEKFHLDDYPTEIAIRHRYNALCKTWVVDEIQVKMEPKSFNHGAMRECYRMRKLNKNKHATKWKTAANYVAKAYFDEVDRDTYFEDVKLQMDAKLWGEEFNRHNPPKKVDIFQVSVLEFLHREGKPLYHVEHFIEGNYIKYNSNSGYVNDEARFTPQAFSHFTFERSGHELIVVDIQGVGDLYTDPQIHTASGKEYGDGNLGTRGMALFFHSHDCNVICEGLGLSKFDLYTSEVQALNHHETAIAAGATCTRGTEELCVLPSYYERTHLNEFLRSRSLSGGSIPSDEMPSRVHLLRTYSETSQGSTDDSDNDSGIGTLHRRQLSVQDSNVSSLPKEVDQVMFSNMIARRSRPSSVFHEIELRKLRENSRRRTGGSVLGQIHLELAKYHEGYRFTTSDEYDKDAALFHLQHSADCDTLEAIINLSRIYLNFPHDVLVDIEPKPTLENITKGMDFVQIAAEAGDRPSMVILAQAFDTGYNLGLQKKQSWKEAVYWYNEAVVTDDHDESGQYDGCIDNPKYLLLARLAELYSRGGNSLAQNVEKSAELYQRAGEEAMLAMKGRLASKYYMLAEEVGCETEQ